MMSSSLIWILACPLGMFAMGGIAWGIAKLPGRRAERLARVANRATCMPMAAKSEPVEVQKNPFGESSEEETPAHV
ncbi:MAG TPA: hypothetical protein VMU55_02050 [Solirubrobacteraceae bacterium]|nr:hypothetical protein [Solirubrobacteraceae bacterium]